MRIVVAGFLLTPAAHLPVALAQQSTTSVRNYSIPTGPLPVALMCFVSESGIYLAGTTDLAHGKNSPGLRGSFSVPTGLQELLIGTGLEAVVQLNGEYTLRRVATQYWGDTILPMITVSAQVERLDTEGRGSYIYGKVCKHSDTAESVATPNAAIRQRCYAQPCQFLHHFSRQTPHKP